MCSYYVFCSKNEIICIILISISECMVIVFCDDLLMFDVYGGYFILICVFRLLVLKIVNKVCLVINCLILIGVFFVE